MHIDWFVFLAQIVNFLILVYLLKRFLYGRIIQAMDRRENMIVSRFEEAERLRKEAETLAAHYEEKNRLLAEKQEELLNQMVQAAEAKKKELLEKARADVDAIRSRWQETLKKEKESFLQDLSQRVGRQTYTLARRILSAMADAELEEKMAKVFLRRLQDLSEDERKKLKEAIQQSGGRIVVQSAFPLSPAIQAEIRAAFSDGEGGILPEVRFETLEEAIAGIELRTHGYKLAWSIGDYLENLEETFTRALLEEARVRA
ncbi:MAG TPA: hypothetical protein PLT64_05865 [Syntrophales bacterium]|nr:hypothetical protein [Syntrophales bacterium]HOL59380.1 hypothetical protein [Syntrophales bacterium]HPO35537.1 hypothetical protein [Syntrophales bacterium]